MPTSVIPSWYWALVYIIAFTICIRDIIYEPKWTFFWTTGIITFGLSIYYYVSSELILTVYSSVLGVLSIADLIKAWNKKKDEKIQEKMEETGEV